jgi:hypothetical protein
VVHLGWCRMVNGGGAKVVCLAASLSKRRGKCKGKRGPAWARHMENKRRWGDNAMLPAEAGGGRVSCMREQGELHKVGKLGQGFIAVDDLRRKMLGMG